jgi:hypothetical protein
MMLGSGVLAIWNNVTPGREEEFLRWHVREHIPERVSIPGFLRARRYVGSASYGTYFNFYETETVDVLQSPAYRARLDSPTEWTKKVVKEFRDTSRTACVVRASVGLGTGACVETIQLRARADVSADAFVQALRPVLARVQEAKGVVAAHLLEGRHDTSKVKAAEKALMAEPDRLADWIILTETLTPDVAKALYKEVLTDRSLVECGASGDIARSVYTLDFALAKADLEMTAHKA